MAASFRIVNQTARGPLAAAMCAGILLGTVVMGTLCPTAAAQGGAPPAALSKAAPAAPQAGTIEFSDNPTYSVAGVTDWTAVGGHGSDATLRTSEELNREALLLKARAAVTDGKEPTGGSTAHSAADQMRLRGDQDEAQGHPLLAVQAYQQAVQMEPTEANYLAWGTELLQHRAVWQATEVLANAAGALPGSAPIRTAWAAALFAGARYDEASQRLCQASSLAPAARAPYLFAGRIATAAPAANPCIGTMLERFASSNPNDALANYYLAMYLRKVGAEQGRVQHLLERSVQLDPKCSDAYLQLGILAAAHKDQASARALYQQAVQANPENSEAHYRLGVLFDRAGNHDAAVAEYATHQQLDAANAAAVERERRAVQQFSSAAARPAAATP